MAIYRGVGGASSTTSSANAEAVIQASEDAVAAAASAATSETNAAASAAAAANTYDDFDDRYLGAKASSPATDNDGDPLVAGALYFNTADQSMYVYDGSAWNTVLATNTSVESIALTSGQTSVVFSGSVAYAAFYITGPDVDNGRLLESVDYTVDVPTKTVTLTQSYPAGTTLTSLKNVSEAGDITSANSVSYNQGGTGAVTRTVQTKLREHVSVTDFGAVGDGVTDDTAAIQAALDSTAKRVVFPSGNYRITDALLNGTAVLTSTVADRVIEGEGIITATSQVFKVLEVSGANTKVSINVDGNNFISTAIVFTANNCVADGCHIYDLNGSTNYQGVALRFDLDGLDAKFTAINNIITNLQGVGDGTVGNGIGLQRGIIANCNQVVTNRSLIANNHITQVEGEEGDSIALVCSDGASTYYAFPVTVSGNTINLFSRRAVKVQCSQVSIIGNTFSNNRGAALGAEQRAVDIVQGDNCIISNNNFMFCKYMGQIAVFRDVTDAANDIQITNNTIMGLGTETSNALIAAQYVTDLAISGNVITTPAFANTAYFVSLCTNVFIDAWNTQINSSGTRMLDSNNNQLFFAGNGGGSNGAYRLGSYNGGSPDDSLVVDVTKAPNRSFVLYNDDVTLSSDELIAQIAIHQNDASSDEVTAAIEARAVGSAGVTKFAIKPGRPSGIGTPKADGIEVDDNSTAGNTRFLIYDVDNAQLERVSVGAADSGGVGFKVLRIPN